jgi:methionine-rich copper-binding protein CopC
MIQPSLATGVIARSTLAISSLVALAAIAHVALYTRHPADDPMATDAPSRSNAAVLGPSAEAPARLSPSPASGFDEAFVDHRQPGAHASRS